MREPRKVDPHMQANAMTLRLNDANLVLVSRLRHAALKSSADFSIASFFDDPVYADACLIAFDGCETPELSSLATQVLDARCEVWNEDASSEATASPATHAEPRPSSAQRFTAAKELMNGLAVEAVGVRSFFFVLKLETCSTCAELSELLDAFQKLLAKGRGEVAASVMVQPVRQLLA